MPFAQLNPDIRVAIKEAIEVLPKLHVRDWSTPFVCIRPHPLPAVAAPDEPPSAAAFKDMGGVRPYDHWPYDHWPLYHWPLYHWPRDHWQRRRFFFQPG